ncbi:alpha/beta fold hydrolase [Ancylobacter mangrovi]|uniref:alpha/beta fold hydrolase n=1 Tax=Ancylobacter mangrovi TaxID=2972472 RepID=UPI0021626DEC|nr:alpha/beta hydrolase [Ancylobacter mangrovi]MCS0504708.1 alpha/beta hydrolase [Ancylobacter mangrovi]
MDAAEARRFIEAADARAEHAVTGSEGGRVVWRLFGAGPPLVLLHGGFGSWLHWLPMVERLEGRFRLLLPDMPGLGDSDPVPPDATPALLADRLAAGLAELAPAPAPIHVAGFSFGGLVAVHLARRLDAQLAGLVLVAGGGLGEERDAVDLRSRRPGMSEGEMRSVAAHNLKVFMIADPARVDALAVEIQHCNTRRRPELNSRVFSRTRDALGMLKAVKAPVGAVWGTRDPTVGEHLAERRRAVEAACPGALTAALPGCGHWIMQERPVELAAFLMRTFEPGTFGPATGGKHGGQPGP